MKPENGFKLKIKLRKTEVFAGGDYTGEEYWQWELNTAWDGSAVGPQFKTESAAVVAMQDFFDKGLRL